MLAEITTINRQKWTYETDEKTGICIIAKDAMQIKFVFECRATNKFFDVLKIDKVIEDKLKEPVSVEGMADYLHSVFPSLTITATGRAFSHGWITSKIYGKTKWEQQN